MQKILKSNLVDILSVNENEAIIYARLLTKILRQERSICRLRSWRWRRLGFWRKHLHARIDLHTTAFSATLRGKAEVVAPTFRVKVLRATGAGDAWTAGNISRRPQRSFRHVPLDVGERGFRLLPIRPRRQTSNMEKTGLLPQGRQ